MSTLDVYLRNQHVGQLHAENAQLSFRYLDDYLEQDDAMALSSSLPLQATSFEHTITASYFSGLLPDEVIRKKISRYLKISEKNIFGLLKAIGGECAGAVSLFPAGTGPDKSGEASYRILSDNHAHAILCSLDQRPFLAGEDNIRISGAGAQNKMMIALVDQNIAIPTHNTPSTHIIKPAIAGLESSVYNEFFCQSLAKHVGLTVPKVSIITLVNTPYYLIERYDRLKSPTGLVTRLHQEDFCQALHIPPEIKYEEDGGPTLLHCFELIEQRMAISTMQVNAKLDFLRAIMFNYLIGNGDAHGKNFSLLYNGKTESLAPLYDLLCTLVYDNIHKAKMAMKIGGKYKFKDVCWRHWEQLAEAITIQPKFLMQQMQTMIHRLSTKAPELRDKLNQDPKTASAIYDDIVGIIEKQCQRVKLQIEQR